MEKITIKFLKIIKFRSSQIAL